MRGWKITIVVSLGLLALSALQIALWGSGEEGVRVVVRSSARSSVLLFALAFSASAARTLWRAEPTRWLLANRRYVGVSYAVSHAIHALALAALAGVSSEFRGSVNAVTLIGGGLAYVFTFAMAVTSNDASVRALGSTRWRRLHWLGGWYIWIIFAQSYLPRAAMAPAYLPAALVVLAVPVLRGLAHAKRRVPRTPDRLSPPPEPAA